MLEMKTANKKFTKDQFKSFLLLDLHIRNVTEKDIDILLKTHTEICNKDYLSRQDISNVFEHEFKMWQKKMDKAG